MYDPRVELSTLTGGGDAVPILHALDSVELVIEAPAERTRSREDQVGLYNVISSAARLFPHIELGLEPGVPADLAPLASGDLVDDLRALHVDLAPAPTVQPRELPSVRRSPPHPPHPPHPSANPHRMPL